VDLAATKEEEFTLVAQANGKLRDRVDVPVGISKEKAKEVALACENVVNFLDVKTPKKVIYVPGRLINIVA